MSGGVLTVSDLTDPHIGWLIKTGPARGDSEYCRSRTFTLKGIRVWTYEGRTTVGLLDPSDARGNIIGDERHYDPSAPCELVRPITAKAKRLAKASAS
jgi:hypothetical protein